MSDRPVIPETTITKRPFFETPKRVIVAFVRPPLHAEEQQFLPTNANTRTAEPINGHRAPNKPEPSLLAGRGRAPGHTISRQQKFTSINIRGILSAMKDNFGVEVFDAPANLASFPQGRQLTWKEKVTIERQQAKAYGDLFAMQTEQGTDFMSLRTHITDANPQGY